MKDYSNVCPVLKRVSFSEQPFQNVRADEKVSQFGRGNHLVFRDVQGSCPRNFGIRAVFVSCCSMWWKKSDDGPLKAFSH